MIEYVVNLGLNERFWFSVTHYYIYDDFIEEGGDISLISLFGLQLWRPERIMLRRLIWRLQYIYIFKETCFLKGTDDEVNHECTYELSFWTMGIHSEKYGISFKEFKEIVVVLQRKCTEILCIDAFTFLGVCRIINYCKLLYWLWGRDRIDMKTLYNGSLDISISLRNHAG